MGFQPGPGENILVKEVLGMSQKRNLVSLQVETSGGMPARYGMMLSYSDEGRAVVKPCQYGVPGRKSGGYRLLIISGANLIWTCRGVLRDVGETYPVLEPFQSVEEALEYGRTFVAARFSIQPEMAEAV